MISSPVEVAIHPLPDPGEHCVYCGLTVDPTAGTWCGHRQKALDAEAEEEDAEHRP